MAVTVAALPVTASVVALCKRGHPQTDENVTYDRHSGTGRVYGRCKPCKAVNQSQMRTRRLEREQATGMAPPPGATSSLWFLMPADFQRRLAGVLMSPPPGATASQIAVLRTASQRQTWYRADKDTVVRLFIEAVVDISIDARSESCRVDRVLALLFID